jgi:hypothetical protein
MSQDWDLWLRECYMFGGWGCLGAAGSGPGRGQDALLLFDRILCAVRQIMTRVVSGQGLLAAGGE